MKPITKHTNFGEMLGDYNHPRIAQLLREYGLSMKSCSTNLNSSIESVFRALNLNASKISEAVGGLNVIIEEEGLDKHGAALSTVVLASDFTISTRAAQKIAYFVEKNGFSSDEYGLRLRVVPGGCSGNQYFLSIDKQKESDITLEKKGAKVFMDKTALQELKGGGIEYNEDLMSSGFKIDNPNASKLCFCGKSFG